MECEWQEKEVNFHHPHARTPRSFTRSPPRLQVHETCYMHTHTRPRSFSHTRKGQGECTIHARRQTAYRIRTYKHARTHTFEHNQTNVFIQESISLSLSLSLSFLAKRLPHPINLLLLLPLHTFSLTLYFQHLHTRLYPQTCR